MTAEISNVLANAQGGHAIENLAASFGLTQSQTQSVVDDLTQALGFQVFKNSLSPSRLADVVGLFGDARAGRALNDPSALKAPDTTAAGDSILNVLIGDKHTSRGLANKTARATGVDAETIKRMLPVVASLMIGATQSKVQTVLPQQLQGVPDIGDLLPMPGGAGNPRKVTTPNDDWTDAPARVPLPQTPSGNRNGGGVLLPLPGDKPMGGGSSPSGAPRPRTGYDDIGDILRRGGGGQVQLPQGGGTLENLIRSVLGGLFGYRPRGVIGSMIYMMVMRWLMSNGWRILSRILFRR